MPFPRLATVCLAVVLLTAACSDESSSASGDSVSRESVVGLTYTSFDGDERRFDDHLGTPIVVNFFAEWCVNCITEMPEFEKVSQELLGDVQFLGISIDRGSDAAQELVDTTGVTYDVGWDPSEQLYAHFQGLSMPTTAFVDEQGTITRVWSGVLSADALRDKINEEIL